VRDIPFLSLLLLNRRPNLGLFRPEKASHLREKGVWDFPMLESPILLNRDKTSKNLNGNSSSVKSIISIISPIIIEKPYSYISMLLSPNPSNLMFFVLP
jgi:hypothetical protein